MKEPSSIVYNEDCMEGMKRFPDKHFDLAVVDPPYGIGISNNPFRQKFNKSNWDCSIPDKKYFDKLFELSQNQIIWGGNYFELPVSQYFLIWDKGETMYKRDFAECEFAWSSLGQTRIFKYSPNQSLRIHPTQKPVKLYEWILINYAKEGDLILDTHVGSGSSRIAAYKHGFDYVGFEIDKEYFDAQEKRFNEFKAQLTLF